MGSGLDNFHSWVASVARLGRGLKAWHQPARHPHKPLELFEFESCPYCRKVREVFTEADLEYVCRPCGRGSNNRQTVIERGGKALFPFLLDPNTGRSMYESEDIITYLLETYGSGRKLPGRVLSPLNTVGSAVASAIRPKGGSVRPGCENRTQPQSLLELYNFEASPYCRKVRERLCELNLDHRVKNVGKKSARRPQLVERGGRMMVPYLIDPNTGTELYESEDIMIYLDTTYSP